MKYEVDTFPPALHKSIEGNPFLSNSLTLFISTIIITPPQPEEIKKDLCLFFLSIFCLGPGAVCSVAR